MRNSLGNRLEIGLFRNKVFVLIIFALASAFLLYQATQIKFNTSFTKTIPLNHHYMKTYTEHKDIFGGANKFIISVCNNNGSIFTDDIFNTVKAVHDKLLLMPSVNSAQVKSLYSADTRFIDVVEDGLSGGPVIPNDFQANNLDLAMVKNNIEKADIIGSIVSYDQSCAMVQASLLDFNPEIGEEVNSLSITTQLEQEIKKAFEKNNISIHLVSFANMMGHLADNAKSVISFLAITVSMIIVMIFFSYHSVSFSLLPIACSLFAVIWQVGILHTLGFGLNLISIVVLFVVFIIGVSHALQMINSVVDHVKQGRSCQAAAQVSFSKLLTPGCIALLSNVLAFSALLLIDIELLHELAITASLGVAVIILTNLIILPLLVSYTTYTPKNKKLHTNNNYTKILSRVATKGPAAVTILLTVILSAAALFNSQGLTVGELSSGTDTFYKSSRYNQDLHLLSNHYSYSLDHMSVLVESTPDACTYHDTMNIIDQFQWRIKNIQGVRSVASLATTTKLNNANYNEGNPKWRVIPRNQQKLVESIARIPSSSGLLNGDCSVMPIIIFLQDHKAETIVRVFNEIKLASTIFGTKQLQFKLASGPIGALAATNETITQEKLPLMLYVYGAMFLVCILCSRCLKTAIVVVVPLYVVSTLAQWLMVMLDIGLTLSTLPVLVLGIGIGIDYGVYILSSMKEKLKTGAVANEAYFYALQKRGGTVFLTAVTLSIGVSSWLFSSFKYQSDMGELLTFMILGNMIASLIIMPALASYLWLHKKA